MIWNHIDIQDPNAYTYTSLRTHSSHGCTLVSILLPLDITACPLFPIFCLV